MKEFIFKACSDDGTIMEDSLRAPSRQEAAEEIFSRNLHLIHLEEKKEPSSFSFRRRPFSSRQKLSLFAEEWASLLDAGLTITDSISLLENQMERKERDVLSSITKTISSGHSVGESFERARCFPPFFLSLLSVGELSGTLPEELHRLSRYYLKEDRFISQLKGALAYPLFVTAFALCLFIVILTFILPSFALLFDSLSIPFPPVASLALSLGLWLKDYGLYLALFLLLSLTGAILFSSPGKASVPARICSTVPGSTGASCWSVSALLCRPFWKVAAPCPNPSGMPGRCWEIGMRKKPFPLWPPIWTEARTFLIPWKRAVSPSLWFTTSAG